MKLILIIAAIAFGIWLAFNYPDKAQMVLDYVLMAKDYVWGLVQEALK
jgi:hypothetical protein